MNVRRGSTAGRGRTRADAPIATAGRPRAPGFTLGVLACTMVVLVAIVATTSRQNPPPTIVEFAPQAVEQITDASDSLGFGTGAGAAEPAPEPQTVPATAPGTSVIEAARVRACVGDPPRQIEDPQSPPCVPYWTGDNGGATYKGVTRDQVRVMVVKDGVQSPDSAPQTPNLEAFFNRRFEFYGRRLKLVVGVLSQYTAAGQRAFAVRADEQERVFAATEYRDGDVFPEEMARRGLIAEVNRPLYSEEFMSRWRPYIWQYAMATDRIEANIGEWTCKRLAGRPAAYAGDPLMRGRTRAFGVLVSSYTQEFATTGDVLKSELARCGVEPVATVHHDGLLDYERGRNTMLQMRQAGASTILCVCHFWGMDSLTKGATSEGYFPEWVVSSYGLMDHNWGIRTWVDPYQREHLFGLTFIPRQVTPDQNPSLWANKEVDPSYDDGRGNEFAYANRNPEYRDLLLIASGIQMAGPHLTPESFERGLQAARFPNPDHPIRAGAVGFAGSHAMTIDGAEWWWSNTERGPYTDSATGTICYVDGGARTRRGEWTAGEGRLFRGPCDSGAR